MAFIQKVELNGNRVYEVSVFNGAQLHRRRYFKLDMEKNRMIDWATEQGAREVTFLQ